MVAELKLSPVQARVLLVLDEYALTAAEVAEESGGLVKRNTAQVTLTRLEARGLVERDGDGWAATPKGDKAVRVHQAMLEEAGR